ncbi:SET domain [Lasallia pustulata]|uniref:SET domain n=1 Tax=Lasallia pustulata TaxID=136370 RepID=A0A1W5DC75_9LECA|nr:SET domain [Lasallia pustulata]
MGSKSFKQKTSKACLGRKDGTSKGLSKKTIDKGQPTPKKGGKRPKVAEGQELMFAAASTFQKSASRPHEDLDKSRLFQSIETADDDATTQLLSQIYADLHEVSFDGLTKYTKDLKLPPFWVPDPADASDSGWLRHSVQSRLILHTQEMFSVIDDAYTSADDRAVAIFNAVNSVRVSPDKHRRVQSMAWKEERRRLRYRDFAASHGWMMLSIVANSRAFRTAGHAIESESWSRLTQAITKNSHSLEMFAKIRGLDWQTALINHPSLANRPWLTKNIQSNYELKPDSPHHRIVPSEPTVLPMRPSQEHDQININDIVFDPNHFTSKPRPAYWPSSLHYPVDDPTTRLISYGACALCNNSEYANCGCHPSTHRAVIRPLVELIQIPGKGVGVRALQPIREGAILHEYVGVLIPINADPKDQDIVYGMAFNPTPQRGFDKSIVSISSMRYGNWTRFINHSCASNALFRTLPIGRRMRVMVLARRDIRFGEELTIDYGNQYWTEDKLCKCGEPECKYGTRKAIAKNTPGGRRKRQEEIAAKESAKKRKIEETEAGERKKRNKRKKTRWW